jgi:hypothetical protein
LITKQYKLELKPTSIGQKLLNRIRAEIIWIAANIRWIRQRPPTITGIVSAFVSWRRALSSLWVRISLRRLLRPMDTSTFVKDTADELRCRYELEEAGYTRKKTIHHNNGRTHIFTRPGRSQRRVLVHCPADGEKNNDARSI